MAISFEARTQLAPSGRLRVVLNIAKFLLRSWVARTIAKHAIKGVSVPGAAQ